MKDAQQILDYLSEQILDHVPHFIMQKEMFQLPASSPAYINAYQHMCRSKWYLELAGEQWEDGSCGRFHTHDSKAPVRQKLVTTEHALWRAIQLGLTKDDPIVAKFINLMEKYVQGENTWRDNIDKHKDNGKSHLH